MGRCWYANYYLNWACGDFERGIAEARRALDSDPLSAYLTMTLGICLFTASRLEEAIDTCQRAIQLDPASFVSRWALGIALGMAGRFDEAVSTLESAAAMSGPPLARRHRSGRSLRTSRKAREGARAASRTDGPHVARLCLGFPPGHNS
jgi:Flp pilus assembly protein TadD